MEQKNTKKVICISVNKADNKKHFEFYNDNNSKYFFVIDNNELFDVYTFARKFNVFLYSIKKYKVCFDLDSFTKIINFDRQLLLNLIVTSIKSIVGNNFSCRSDLILESEKISFVASDNNKKALNESLSLLKAYEHCKHLQSVPSNFITVNKYIEYIKKMFIDVKNVEIEILNHEQLKQRNMNLMLSVCKGNENDGALIVIKYLPIKNQKPIGIIGKGILFDSGGYNIKLNNGMKGMNQDKTGSAITASIAYSLATNNVQTNAIAFLPLCKNMIGLDSSVPGDVYIACDGQSVEITNTDAEGRLLLADTLAYATSVLKIDFEYVITIATLTGLSAITFGDLYTPF